MTTRYVYSTVRFVPNPARGEFVNIGAIIGSDDTREWELRTVDRYNRAAFLDDDGVFANALTIVNHLGVKLSRYTESLNSLLPYCTYQPSASYRTLPVASS